MAVWHYHQLSNIRSVWSPSPGSLLCDRTSGAEVINHYTHPRAAVWHLSSRTATEATQWIQPDLLTGSARAPQKLQSRTAAGKGTHLNPSGRPWIQNHLRPKCNPPALWQTDFCQGTHTNASQLFVGLSSSVRMWTPWWQEQGPIYSFVYPHFSSWYIVQTKFSNYVWWVNKRIEMTTGE